MPSDFPTFDIIVLSIMAFSLLIGLMRGLVHELLSLLSWGGALLVAWFAYPTATVLFQDLLPNAFLRDIAGGVIVFIAAIIVFGLTSSALSTLMDRLEIKSIDRALGGLFGIARGFVVASLLFAFGHWIFENSAPPKFMNEGKTRPFIAVGAKELTLLLSSYESTPLVQRLRSITETGSSALELHQKLISPQTQESTVPEPEKGYKDTERDQLNQLFEQQ